MRAAIVALLLAGATALDQDGLVWGPDDGVKALTAVEGALNKIIANPHLTAAQLEDAKKVVTDVKKDIEYLDSSSKLTKAQRNEKVKAAVGELMDLENKWKASSEEFLNSKMTKLKQQLAAKQAELAKDETMIKLVKMQKELAEKKLQLQKLIDMKKGKKGEASDDEASRKADTKMIATALAGMTKVTNKKDLAKPMDALQAELRIRSHNITQAIDVMDAEDKKVRNDLATAQKANKVTDGDKREVAMMKMLEKEEHRKYAKARAVKKAELGDLSKAQTLVVQRDVPGLQKLLAKMHSEEKALAAKSGNFLY